MATDGTITTAEDTPISDTVPATDVDGDSLTYAVATPPAHGTLTLDSSTGDYTYTPDADYNGADTFEVLVSDGHGGTDTATIGVTVTPVNDAPVASNDSYSTSEDTTLVIPASGVLGNDTDVDGDVLSSAVLTGPAHGSLTLNADGAFTYTPDANYNGADSFTYTVSDGKGGTDTATVTITVTSVNDAPVAANDSFTTAEDTTSGAISLLPNDTDVDGDTLTIQSIAGTTLTSGIAQSIAVTHGTVEVSAAGVVTFSPDAGYNGPVSFDYVVSDGHGATDTATVTGTVSSVNDAPVATDGTITTPEDTPISDTVPATDVDGDSLTYAVATPPAHGTLTLDPSTGDYIYTPDADYNGADTFEVLVSDGHGGTDTATIGVTVTPVNDAPVASNDSYSTSEDTALVIPASGILGNDTDVDGDALSSAILTGPAHGSLTLNADGAFTYTPDANYNGADTFTYTVSDGHGGTDTATVTITVTSVNDAPVAANDTFTTAEDTTSGAISLLPNDTDVDGDTLTVQSIAGTTLTPGVAQSIAVTHGTVEVSAAGVVTFTPDANYNGPVSFDYVVSDGHGGTDTATVTGTVTSVNDAPVATDGTITTAEDTPISDTVPATDVDGDSLTYAVATPPAHGTLTLDPSTGDYTYTPDADYNGADTFEVLVSDGDGGHGYRHHRV